MVIFIHQFQIFLASPDDVPLERKLAREAIPTSTASGAFAADDPELTVKLDQWRKLYNFIVKIHKARREMATKAAICACFEYM